MGKLPKPVKSKGGTSVLDGGLSEGVMQEMQQNGGAYFLGEKHKPKSRKEGMQSKFEVLVYGRDHHAPLTVEEAMELIGWTVVEDGPFHLKDIHDSKIRLLKNSTNRPFRPGLMKRWTLEIIRGKWGLNGETIIFDWDDRCQSGQHRLAGFILAEETRREQKEKWSKYHKGPITMECIVVKGIDPALADTIDQGQKRTIGDVFFRKELFGGGSKPATYSLGEGKDAFQVPVMGPKLRQKLCNIAAGATRLVWMRAGGKTVSDAPQFPVTEAIEFLTDHPGLLYSVAFINALEGGEGKEGQKVSRFVTLAYASALFYMMATSGTDQEEYLKLGSAALDFKMAKKAKEFWAALAKGAELKEDSPIFVVRELLPKINAGSAVGREEKVATVVKAFNAFMDNKKCKVKDLVVRKTTNEHGLEKLADDPRLGGLDVEGAEKPDEQYEPEEDTREGSKSKRGWAEGDTCWVKGQDGDNWFGTIQEVIKAEKGAGQDVAMIEADDGQVWEENVGRLSLKYPG